MKIYTVYILFSGKDRKLYVGCTNDLQSRLKRHSLGYVPATKHRLPIFLIHQEEFDDKSKAFQKERFLKSLWGVREKKKILKKYLDSIDKLISQ